jgi:hemoglobin
MIDMTNKTKTTGWKFLKCLSWKWLALTIPAFILAGCGSNSAKKSNENFFTSGSREADQRASQRMAQQEQLAETGEGSGEKGAKKTEAANTNHNGSVNGKTNTAVKVEGKLALFDRLGGVAGISNIVADFTPRVLADPRVNWERNGVKRGGLSLHSGQSVEWKATPQNVTVLKQHLAEFLALATGGPPHYTGKDLKSAHADMHISNPEFDAVIGDLKSSLDKLEIPNREQKELLAIVESTRPQIVTER